MVCTLSRGKSAALGALILVVFAACGGQSKGGRGIGGSDGGGVAGSAGGAQPGSCLYNGVRYESGESFGACEQCSCVDGGISCDPIDCTPAAGGSGGARSGGAGTGGASTGGAGTGGASTGGTGGASTGDGGANSSVAGATACELATIGSLCVLGSPTPEGQELIVGAPLVISLQPAGCYSSSCTKLVSSSCSYLGSGLSFWISGFVCLGKEGEACTSDCNGARAVSCTPGVTLEAGEYTVGLGGTSESVSFKVPSRVPDRALCVSTSDQK
jgi:hypothetical protein